MGSCPVEDSPILWGEEPSLALVGNPSRDSVSIKNENTGVEAPYTQPSVNMSELCLVMR